MRERRGTGRFGLGATVLAVAIGAGLGAASPARAQAPSTAPAARTPSYDWVSGRRRFMEGDVLTILIDEYSMASANRSSVSKQDRRRDMGLDARQGVRGGASSQFGADAGLRSTVAGEASERGQTSRQDRLSAELTATIVEVEPNGMLRIEGKKRITIDDHEQVITLTGRVRSEDVSAGNVVESARLADAEIAYESNGKLVRAKGGLIGRILGWFWP